VARYDCEQDGAELMFRREVCGNSVKTKVTAMGRDDKSPELKLLQIQEEEWHLGLEGFEIAEQ